MIGFVGNRCGDICAFLTPSVRIRIDLVYRLPKSSLQALNDMKSLRENKKESSTATKTMITRSEVKEEHTWSLGPLYANEDAWENDFHTVEKQLVAAEQHRGTLGQGSTALCRALELYLSTNRTLERVYVYAHLRSDEDTGNTSHLGKFDQAANLAARLAEAWSFLQPELLSLSQSQIEAYLHSPELQVYKRIIQEIVRYKPHTLNEDQEQLLAAGSEIFTTCERIFSQLNNADLCFPPLTIDGTESELSHSSYMLFLKHARRDVRKQAFETYYAEFDNHRNTIATTLSGSIKKNIYLAKARRFSSSRESSLFADNIPTSVYDNLISTVSNTLKPLHRYYEVRKKMLKLQEMRIYDTYVPLVSNVKTHSSYEEAVGLVIESLRPLGSDYTNVLQNGLGTARWVDRFENKGKRSGAYSSGCFDSPPYILMNYKEDSLNDVFTLTHEAGHSMHTYYSNTHQPYEDHNYTIFVAEVASTLNEQLLCDYLLKKHADDERMLAYLINHQIDDIKSTLYRQTMFAEFEFLTHELAERYEPLTVDSFRGIYGKLLKKYFGDAVSIEALDELECFRIPHFYSAFYVYKYATGISAAIALSEKILKGSASDRERYLKFLCSGGSRFPLDLLRDAGVDIEKPAPIEAALKKFSSLVDRLDLLLSKLL